jgi:hypothetical protein
VAVTGPDSLAILRALAEAHATPDPRSGSREPIWYLMHIGGADLHHHALPDPAPQCDEAVLQELASQGLLYIDYREHHWNLVPTAEGRRIIEQHKRVENLQPVADVRPLVEAVREQAASTNKFAWPAVRPVLTALRGYWESGGFSPHGIQVPALVDSVPEQHRDLFAATVRALIENDYVRSGSELAAFGLPVEVVLTDRAHRILDGWPGAGPDELVENLLAVLTKAAAFEMDPGRRSRLERFAETVREIGVSTVGEVLAKVMMGA